MELGGRFGGFLRPRLRPLALGALHVACIMAIAYLLLQARQTDEIFDRLVSATTVSSVTDTERAIALMHATHKFQSADQANPALREAPAEELINSIRTFAEFPGDCGSFTAVLAKALQRAGIDFRILQMVCNGTTPACHILLEARLDGHWAVLDPTFDQYYRRPDGRLASYADVGAQWKTYQRQIPEMLRSPGSSDAERYDVTFFDYAGVRYTNWEKFPVILPAVHAVLNEALGPEVADHISLRSYVFDTIRVYLVAMTFAYLCLMALTIAWWRKLP